MPSNTPNDQAAAVREILSNVPFLGGFTEDELALITSYFEHTSAPSGKLIICKGEQPSHLYVILSGRVELQISDKDKAIHKRTFEVGDHFGEVAMLALINEAASFVALEDCELLAFPGSAFYKLRKESPDLFGRIVLNLARDLARKVQYSDELMLHG